jgi:Ca-activated chloride channel family protein
VIVSYLAARSASDDPAVDWRDLFSQLWLRANGDMDQILSWLRQIAERYGLPGPGKTFEDLLDELEEMGLLKRERGGIVPTTGTRQAVRDAVFDRLMSGLGKGAPGSHPSVRTGPGPERQPSTREWKSGDEVRDIDWSRSLRNTLSRGAGINDLEERDLEAWETEATTSCATVVMVDVSHSMVLYGEDRITPAKAVAIGLSEFIRRKHPRDSLDVVAFGDEAWRIPTESLAELAVGPYHTNTADGLRLARDILRKRRAANRRILLITDGKPSCIFDKGRLYKNPFGLDPLVVERTLSEGRRCRREGCLVSTFMIAQDPLLVEFVELFTRAVQGQAFYTGLDDLGAMVLRDWASNRRRKI